MMDIVKQLRNHALPDPHDEREVMHAPLLKKAADEIEHLRAKVAELEQVLSEDNCPRKYVQQGGYIRCLYGTSSIAAYETLSAEVDALRKVFDAAENLVKVKGRFHSEQAYGRLVTAVAGMKVEE